MRTTDQPGLRAAPKQRLAAGIALLVTTSLLAPAAMAAPTEITVWRHIGDLQPEMDTFASYVSDFNASQGDWKVVWEELPQQSYDDSINAAALSNNLPCMIDVDGPFVPNFAWSGNIVPLDDYITPELRAELLPSVIGSYNGKTYSVGQFEASLAVWGRKSVLEKHGIRIPTVEQPWTKDEFDSALKTLKDSGEFETAIDMFTFYTHEWLPYAYSPFLQSFGGDLIDRSSYLTAEGVAERARGRGVGRVVAEPVPVGPGGPQGDRRPGLHPGAGGARLDRQLVLSHPRQGLG
jgi:multiple sugar transport system substrate-binding protein